MGGVVIFKGLGHLLQRSIFISVLLYLFHIGRYELFSTKDVPLANMNEFMKMEE